MLRCSCPKSLYGVRAPLTVLHPSRYLMQAVPFLFEAPLWMHRAWQVLLWLLTSGLTGWLVARRAAGSQPWIVRLSLAVGAILFLFQGPVYYHLLVMVIFVLWGFNRAHPWRNLVVVLLASLWAGISRVNWLPVPGMLAAAMYFLEVPYSLDQTNKGFIDQTNKGFKPLVRLKSMLHMGRYLLPSAVWTILGSLVAWGSQQVYQGISGNPDRLFRLQLLL